MNQFLNKNWIMKNALLLVTLISIAALGFAFISQYVFGLAPCELCIFQRIPYATVIVLGIIGLLIKKSPIPALCLALSGLAFFANTFIAAFHAGVEQKWWEGLSSCGGSFSVDNLEEMKNAIMNAPVTRCDEIAWQFMGISMAGYNVILCLALTIFTVYALQQNRKV